MSKSFFRDGQVVGSYHIEFELGSGGMKTVYKAFDQKFSRHVALAMLHVGAAADHEERLRFLGEAEVMAKLQHTNVVQVFDHGEHDGKMYLVMEFIDGGNLEEELQQRPQYPRRAAEMVKTLAEAMHTAHEKGIVHRDLKPGNVMRTTSGVLKITDFGLAKRLHSPSGLTVTGAQMGTPQYMAPEQWVGKSDVGPAADIYALGAMLYEMLTGRPPFLGASLLETQDQVLNAEPAPPSRLVQRLPRDIQTICLKCLHKSPGRRYATARELADDLNNFLEGLPVKARPTHGVERVVRTIARKPKEAALVATAVGLVVLAIVFGLVMWNVHNTRLADEAEKERQAKAKEQQEEYEKTKRAKDTAKKSLEDLKKVLQLTLAKDLHTPAGLAKLEGELSEQQKEGGGGEQEDAAERASVLAEAYSRLAALRREHGDIGHALTNLEEARKLAAKTVEAKQGDFASAMLLARIYQERGELQWELNPPQSVEDSGRALKLLEAVEGQHPAEVWAGGKYQQEYVHLRALALHHLGLAKWRLRAEGEARERNMADAERAYREAEELLRTHTTLQDPDDKRRLARVLGRRGDLYLDWNRFPEADGVYLASHKIREELAVGLKPYDFEPRYQLARSWENLGLYQTRQSSLEFAALFHRESEKLRLELYTMMPTNKDYTLEVSDALHRIAELELFLADQGPDATRQLARAVRLEKLAVAEERLKRSHTQLLKLLEVVEANTRPAIPVHSRLGECRALQARAWLLRDALTQDPTALDKARKSAQEAREAFGQVAKLRAESGQPSSPPTAAEDTQDDWVMKYLSPDELYQEAASQCLSLEINVVSKRVKAEDLAKFIPKAEMKLKVAIDLGFRRLSPREVDNDRAFRSVREREGFKAQLARLDHQPTAPTAPEGENSTATK